MDRRNFIAAAGAAAALGAVGASAAQEKPAGGNMFYEFRKYLTLPGPAKKLLEDYLLSKDVYWPIGVSAPSGETPYPRFTLGGMELALLRLQASPLNASRQAQVAEIAEQVDAVRSRWRTAWGRIRSISATCMSTSCGRARRAARWRPYSSGWRSSSARATS
jgi:hypothetical protein